jgi:carbon-monoxide dehydrogenase medium subunit/xanthine dehydrogenase FAD-binding subunit
MQDYDFFSANSVEEGLSFLSEKGARCRVIAGGTDLIPLLRNEEDRPAHVLNILNVEDLKGVREEHDRIWIGPTTTFTEIMRSEILQLRLPLLVLAASSVGAPQIRNRGTVGGNIATASPAADVLPALMALEGALEVRARGAEPRTLPLTEAVEDQYKTRLRPDELITGISIPKPAPDSRMGFEKLGRRRALARARMNISIVLRTGADGSLSDVRIVPGAVMPVARRIKRAESLLQGRKPEDGIVEAAAEALADGVLETTGRRWSSEYKLPVMKNVFKRVLKRLV